MGNLSRLFLEPEWHPLNKLSQGKIPDSLSPWMLDEASLTKRLQDHCRGSFRVHILTQGRLQPYMDERILLGMRSREYGFIRQVHLFCDNKPVVFARTIIPLRTLKGKQKRLSHLGNRSLGEVLFSDSSVNRIKIEIARISMHHGLYKIATANVQNKANEIWGRRSLFWCRDKPLLVNEIFLSHDIYS